MNSNQEEKIYAERFNQGYLLAKHEPELFAQITKGNLNSEYISAMKEGGKEAELEKFKERMAERDKEQENDREHEIG